MQTWKVKRKAPTKKQRGPWGRRVLGILFLLATLLFAAYDFPGIWNQYAGAVVQLPDEPFQLGLDLQGGTHLVYEADMSEIEEGARLDALEGVRDVIERRVNAFGVSEPVVQTTTTGGNYRVVVELAGVLDVHEAIALIGETPILEFKEPGSELGRDLTEEEQASLDAANVSERELAQEVLKRAKAGENFNALVSEYSVEEDKESTQGVIDGIGAAGIYAPLGEAIASIKPYDGQVLTDPIETVEGINIVKFRRSKEVPEYLLSHLLICFEGTTGCGSDALPQIDADILVRKLREEITQENFAELVAANSTDKSSADGDLGWVIPGEAVPAFELAAAGLPVGEISNPIETEFGYHLIWKRDQRMAKTSEIQRVVLPLTTAFDVAGNISPWKNTELSGKDLERAAVEFSPQTGVPYVSLQFSKEGGELFGQLTAAHVGDLIAIFLDGEPISTPVVNQAIYGGSAVIQGDFTLEEAKILAQRLNAGALPVPINLLSQQTVGPTLGAISLQKSITAGFWGFFLVALFMILLYRLGGFVAVIALIFYGFLNLAAYRFFGVTITLAGIAGFVLSLGIAVDANVLILERFKEELASGRDFRSAMDEAIRRAWSAIRDGNLTTLIAAAVLYWFSSSFIKGFALTLSIGVVLSMFTAIIVTRVYLGLLLGPRLFQKHALYASKRPASE